MSRPRKNRPRRGEEVRYWRVARQRLDEANSLLQSDFTTAAVYLAGYSVECALKALLLSHTPLAHQAELLAEFRGRVGHDLDGLKRRYLAVGTIPKDVLELLVFVDTWSTELRYTPGTTDPATAEEFLGSVTEILEWVKGRL